MIVKSDQEPGVASIVEDVVRRRALVGGGRWICENPLVGSSASNGVVERQQVRVSKLAL